MTRAVFRSQWEKRFGRVESPIEAAFLESFCPMAIEHGYVIAKRSSGAWTIIIEPQRWFDQYRLDFLITYPFFGDTLQIAVECDGHDFHEKTKAQARKDKARDRSLQRLGVEVFRFAGSELHASANTCAAEVLDAIEAFQTECCVRAMEEADRRAA